MNGTFIPDTAPDGSERGQHPAPGPENQPEHPTECIKVPPTPASPFERLKTAETLLRAADASGFWQTQNATRETFRVRAEPAQERSWFNEVGEITQEMWDKLQPASCPPARWRAAVSDSGRAVRQKVEERIRVEKQGKIFPLSWGLLQEMCDAVWKEHSEQHSQEARDFEAGLRAMDGLRGPTWEAADKMITKCVVQAGANWASFRPASSLVNIFHRIAQAAHKAGAQEMKAILEARGHKLAPMPHDRELHSQALGEQAALMGMDVLAAALSADVPLPIPPGSTIWPSVRPLKSSSDLHPLMTGPASQKAESDDASQDEAGPRDWNDFYANHDGVRSEDRWGASSDVGPMTKPGADVG